ncbi:MAG: NAD-dependent epimerase/dehydratase family protein [Candidatus Babeliaceae bacterium]
MKFRVLLVLIHFPLILLCADQEIFLIFGGTTGWIGQKLMTLLKEQGKRVISAQSRLENRQDLEKEIDGINPDFVINAAGVTGRPNIDWCEDHKAETVRANIIGTLNLIDVCAQRKIHVTNIATGCIYTYDEQYPRGQGVTEEDKPNFEGSFYSKTKGMVEGLIHATYTNVLTLRVRMPISDDLHPRSIVTKLTHYAKVINIPNSMTVLHDMLPLIIEMTQRKLKGIYNFTNPGTISHNEILDLYKKYIDPAFTYKNFTVEEQAQVVKAPRSNTELNVDKLCVLFPDIPHIQESMHKVFQRMQQNFKQAANAA